MSIWETALCSPTLVLLTQYLLNQGFSVRGVGDGVASNGPGWLHDCRFADILPGRPYSQSQSGYTNSWAALGNIAVGDFCKTVIAHSSSSSCGNTLIFHWERGESMVARDQGWRPPVQEMDGAGRWQLISVHSPHRGLWHPDAGHVVLCSGHQAHTQTAGLFRKTSNLKGNPCFVLLSKSQVVRRFVQISLKWMSVFEET